MREDEYREYSDYRARNSRITKAIITAWCAIAVIGALILILSSCQPSGSYLEADSVGGHKNNYTIERVEFPNDNVVCYVANNGYVGGAAELDIYCVYKGR